MPSIVGDRHNFGNRVKEIGISWIYKPRNIYWEWLLLSKASPLRPILDQVVSTAGGNNADDFLPDLKFELSPLPWQGGFVEKSCYKPISESDEITIDEYRRIGNVLGILSGLGVTDLHFENFALGRDSRRQFVCAPLDLETIFDDLQLPSQTGLISDGGGLRALSRPHCREIEQGDAIAAFCWGYVSALTGIQERNDELSALLETLPSKEWPIRVVLRSTREYLSNKSSFLPEEIQQIKRGDVPYFFRKISSDEIFYFTNNPIKGDGSPLEFKLPSAHTQRQSFFRVLKNRKLSETNHGKSLLHAGVLQAARYMIRNWGIATTQKKFNELTVVLDSKNIQVNWNGINLACGR